MSYETSLDGRVALVTGGSRGIGSEVALALADAGADVAVNYLSNKAAAEEVAEAVRGRGRRSIAVGADVSQAQEVETLIGTVSEQLGDVAILVNNAGLGLKRSIDEVTEEDWDRTLAVNLKSAFLCVQAVFPRMRDNEWGRIVNITSGAARNPGATGVHYNASKAGMEGLTRGYAARLVKSGITVNAVAPSLIETDMLPMSREEVAKRIPVGRAGRPEEVAQAVIMIMDNEYITGQTLHVNGGSNFY